MPDIKLNLGSSKQRPTKSNDSGKPKKRLVFGGDDDEDEAPPNPTKPSVQRSTFKPLKEEDLDPSIYDYDAAFDAIHAKDALKKAAEQEDAKVRRPKYIEGFLASAEVRKRDQLRAREKMLLKEREAEGDQYADREQFVTGAYKKQLAENAVLESEEAKKEAEEAGRREKMGMRAFYQSVMDMEDQRHQETIDAAAQLSSGNTPGLQVEAVDSNKVNLEKAKELAEKGAKITLNDDGQVADKRQLLNAGLNVTAVPKSASGSSQQHPHSTSRTSAFHSGSSSRREKGGQGRERQSQYIEDQIRESNKRAAEEEAEELRKREEAIKSKKTDADISGARARYLERKKVAEMAASKT